MVERELIKNQAKVREFDFNQPVVSVGSHPDNDITLSGPGVLPFHATVVLEAGIIRLIPMEPESQISVDGVQVQTAQVNLENSQRVEIGNYALFFQLNGSPSSMRVKLFPLVGFDDPRQFTMEGGENAILLNVLAHESEIEVDQTAVFELEVINAGPIVASFTVTLKGVPMEWVEISPEWINLNEGQRHLVQVRVTPPRHVSSIAGLHTLQLIVTSPNYIGQRALTDLSLTIRPYYEFSVGNLSPKDQRISWRKKTGTAYLPITNQGNGPADFNLLALDDENGCSFDFYLDEDRQLNRQATTQLQAGETIELPIKITPLKNPMFSMRTKRYHYTTNVQIPQNTVAPQVISGSVTRVPLFGWWSIVLGMAAILLALFIILQPNIRSFNVAAGKDVIELGDTTKLDWDVSPFATRLSISNIDPPITRGQVSQTVAPSQSTTYEMVSGNWLSGLVGLDQKRSVTVLVVPPSPVVNVFDVDKTTLSKGQPVNIRWSVSTADEVFLTIDEVVYPLTPEEYSGERQVILEKDALITLEAKSASGSELQSFFVNVVPPFINISSFTVWVRPDSAAADPASSPPVAMAAGGKLFSRVNAPDPNFPVKFVELIPDVASDTGYRVQFNPAVREELNKGEQVMLEWNVEGVDSLQIAPFTDQLPARGSQPFFPQESMNFVMTAQSGDLQGIFMLPVKVFDGIPPTAPTIDFFNASPQSMLGGGEVEFSWSVSNEWTRVNLSNAGGIIADNLNPVGFKKINIAASSTIILTAYNGKLSTAKPLEITVDPALIAPGLIIKSISPTTGRSMVGGQLIVTVDFESIPDGKPYPIGNVTVTDGSAICSIPLPAVSCNLIFTTSGTKTITASFPGDKIYLQSKSAGFAQQVIVASAQVDLNPAFYFVGGTTPISVESAEFGLDKGIRTVVEVRPKNTVLADNKGSITVSLCQQDVNEAIIESTCVFAASGPVNVASTSEADRTAGYGYADIVIPNFTTSGVYGLLFEYTHSANAIDPASVFQPNIHINRVKLLLSLSYCADQFALTTCKYGLKEGSTPEITFDLNIPGTTTPVKLSSLLPAPKIEAFNITSNNSATWACTVKTVSGTYKLVCSVTGLVAGTSYQVSYSYANQDPLPSTAINHYYMGNDPGIAFGPATFTLNVLSSTKVQIGNLTGVKVGQRIRLSGPLATPGIVSILTGTTRIYPATGITLTEKSGKDIFGVENEGVNCTSSANGSVVTVAAANADCFIFFKHIGSYTLVASFGGDSNYSNSTSGDTPVTVSKQDQISATLQYLGSGGPTIPANFTTNIPAPIRVLMTGPAGGFPVSSAFPPTALVGRKVLVTMSNDYSKNNCSIPVDSQVTDKGGGIYEVNISQKIIPGADPTLDTYVTAADFSVTCTTESTTGLTFVVVFSDKTTPTKDSDDFGFSTSPVTLFQKAVSRPSLGSITVAVKRQDTALTSMLSTATAIDKLHFGQKYTVAITDSSAIQVPYTFAYNRIYTYYWDYTYGWRYLSYSDSANASTLSSNARTQIVNQYNANAKWSVDPSNFLTGVDFGTSAATTCGSNMALTVSSPTYSEITNYTWTGINTYWSGLTYYYDATYLLNVYGTQSQKVINSTGCTLAFEGVSTNTPVLAADAGTIAVNALSGDGRFLVNKVFTVNGIDKQNVSMSFTPSTAQTGYVNIPLLFTITLAPNSGITGGTALPFVSTSQSQNFSTFFSPSSPLTPLDVCPNLSQVGSLSPLSQTYTSTSLYSTACVPQLKYVGNKYYNGTDYINLPGMTFGKHSSSIAFTAALPFTANGAFLETTYTNMKIRVSDGDSHGSTPSPTPGGNLTLQVFKADDTAYGCSDYTLTITPTASCTSGTYTLPLTGGETASFSLLFKGTTVATGNYIKVSYAGDTTFNAATPLTSTFTVKKHASSLNVAQYLVVQGQTWTNLVPTFPTMTVGSSMDMRVRVSDADALSHAEIPTGILEVWMVDASAAILDPGAATNPVYSINLASGLTYDSTNKLYKVTLDSSGYALFTLNFKFAASGLSLKYRYVGDSLFNASGTSTTGPLAFTN